MYSHEVIHAFISIEMAIRHHANVVGMGAWTLLVCEVGPEGIVTPVVNGNVGVKSLRPLREIGTFDSLREPEKYEKLLREKAISEATFKRLTKSRRSRR